MKFLGSKTGLKSEILAKLAYGPPYRFYANEPYTRTKIIFFDELLAIDPTIHSKVS